MRFDTGLSDRRKTRASGDERCTPRQTRLLVRPPEVLERLDIPGVCSEYRETDPNPYGEEATRKRSGRGIGESNSQLFEEILGSDQEELESISNHSAQRLASSIFDRIEVDVFRVFLEIVKDDCQGSGAKRVTDNLVLRPPTYFSVRLKANRALLVPRAKMRLSSSEAYPCFYSGAQGKKQ